MRRLSRVGCRYGFGGRYFTTAIVDGVRNVVLYTRASAPWAIISSASCRNGSGSVWSGRSVGGFGGGEIAGTGAGSVIVGAMSGS